MSQSATAARRRVDPVAIFPFLAWSQRMSGAQMRADLLAGLTGALVVLPQGVAFATIAGMPPQYGLYASIVPTIIAALFGSSWHLVAGPSTTASLVLFASLSAFEPAGTPRYVELAMTLAAMAGVMELALWPLPARRSRQLHFAHGRGRIHGWRRHSHHDDAIAQFLRAPHPTHQRVLGGAERQRPGAADGVAHGDRCRARDACRRRRRAEPHFQGPLHDPGDSRRRSRRVRGQQDRPGIGFDGRRAAGEVCRPCPRRVSIPGPGAFSCRPR